VRAATYRALAALPGVHVRGRLAISGRRGVELAITRAGLAHTLVISPSDGELLAERTVVVDPRLAGDDFRHARPGTVFMESVYETAIVATDSARPAPHTAPRA
jgi:hypothetical protein